MKEKSNNNKSGQETSTDCLWRLRRSRPIESDEVSERGCGAMSGWLSWIKPPHHEFFHTACVLHDELYLLGGSEAERKKADERLYADMVKHSVAYFAKRGMVGSQAWFLTLAYLYYIAVRLFGKGQFNYHSKAPT